MSRFELRVAGQAWYILRAMSTVVRRASANVADYPVLLTRLRETFALGQQKAEAIKVQTYWEAGRLLHEHLRHHEDEPSYGKQVIEKLAATLEIGDELLYRKLRFYEAFPISAGRRKLTWTHYRTLARLPEEKERLELDRQEGRVYNIDNVRRHVAMKRCWIGSWKRLRRALHPPAPPFDVILLREKEQAATVPAIHHMIPRSRQINPQRSRHAPSPSISA